MVQLIAKISLTWSVAYAPHFRMWKAKMIVYWGFSLSDVILFLKNDIRIRSKSCFGWNHTIRIWKLSKSILRSTTYILVLCLFCLMRQN